MKQFNTEEQSAFWQKNEESYKGDKTSPIILSLAQGYIGENTLDVGGGSGALLKNFQKMFADKKITAIDLAPKIPEVQIGDCTDLKFPNDSFDTLFCTDVIEHLNDEHLDKCFKEANRVLKIGGHAIFSTLNNEDLEKRSIIQPETGDKVHKWGHCQSFTENRIKEISENKGFEVVEIKIFSFRLLSNNLIAKIKNLLTRRINPKKDLFFVLKKTKNL